MSSFIGIWEWGRLVVVLSDARDGGYGGYKTD
jgi:hypothetical protein